SSRTGENNPWLLAAGALVFVAIALQLLRGRPE
ncbi:MAG TPA: LPXTG cell wall anchor domain-containing protein, partial [Candidatus Poseidoniales archaeon]